MTAETVGVTSGKPIGAVRDVDVTMSPEGRTEEEEANISTAAMVTALEEEDGNDDAEGAGRRAGVDGAAR